ncbi:ABC transporter substrate-binding protein [Gordonia soli]|uniref:Putative ABC transporter substrate-binding protein n=1 Tax=Gordonia soli NBRC 108243 TaxID=1223545 RepID=M0QGT0_9ACTN|nr:ABC transporter substrate-binding protein [Gordonia soli]GAC67830.1 putative ABC transporter substrate-binding protein [Gordonia soli NBRC 108243]
MHPKRYLAVPVMLISVLVFALGCSSGDEGGSGEASGKVTVDHQYGSTTIEGTPKRVVTLTGATAWSDSLIELGVPITAEFVTAGYSGPNNRFAWTPPHESTVVPVGVGATPDIGQVAKFQPDLILAGYLPDRGAYDTLAKIAPTIPVMGTKTVNDTWQQVLGTAGKIFGKEDQAASAQAEVEEKVEAVKKKYPAAQGKTATFGQLTPQKQFGVVTSDNDPSAKLLAEVGLRLDPAVTALSDNGQRAIVSGERVDLLGSDLLIFWPLVGGPEVFGTIPGWDALPAVRSGATVFLTNDNASAFGAPSVYSVPWAVDELEPALAKLSA